MGRIEVLKTSMKQYICDTLTERIVAGELATGSRLPSIRELADEFGTSISPVHQALQVLEEQGFVSKKKGAGTFVADPTAPFTLAESVAVSVGPASAHVWGDLDRILAQRLHENGQIPLVVSPRTEAGRKRLVGLARSDVRVFIVHGARGCPFQLLSSAPFRDKWVIGLVTWGGRERESLLRVLSDYDEGARRVARHLREKGHHRVLVINTEQERCPSPSDIASYEKGDDFDRPEVKTLAFLDEWRSLGGTWEQTAPTGWQERMAQFDEQRLMTHFQSSAPCTAVFGTMDTLTFGVQTVLRRREPSLAKNTEFTGYYNTPWSEAGHPPFTSVTLRLDELANRACRLIDRVLSGERIERRRQIVPPRLIERGGQVK